MSLEPIGGDLSLLNRIYFPNIALHVITSFNIMVLQGYFSKDLCEERYSWHIMFLRGNLWQKESQIQFRMTHSVWKPLTARAWDTGNKKSCFTLKCSNVAGVDTTFENSLHLAKKGLSFRLLPYDSNIIHKQMQP